MQKAALRAQEAKTLDLLHELEILDTADETEFDGLVKAASRIFGAPIALVSLVAEDRQWFKSKVGISIAESPRDTAFCAHAVLQQDVFEVPDTLEDLRFADNPLVIGPPGIRFYAGAPLSIADGLQIGTLCILDTVPRQLTSEERELLRNLATAVVHAIELRFAKRRLSAIKSKVNPTQTSTSRLMVDAMDLVESAVAQIFEPGDAVPSVPSSNLMGLTDDEHAEADAPTRAAYQAKPAMTAMHFCLTASSALLGIAHELLDSERYRTPEERERAWKQLATDTKIAGRAAYRAALVLVDPVENRGQT